MAEQSNKKRKNAVLEGVFLFIFLGGLLAVLNGMGLFKPRASTEHEVTYKVGGTASTAVVTYTQVNGEPTSPLDIRIPWWKKIDFEEPTTVVLTVGNPSQTGSLECILMLDGEMWKKESVKPPKDKVSCAGIVP